MFDSLKNSLLLLQTYLDIVAKIVNFVPKIVNWTVFNDNDLKKVDLFSSNTQRTLWGHLISLPLSAFCLFAVDGKNNTFIKRKRCDGRISRRTLSPYFVFSLYHITIFAQMILLQRKGNFPPSFKPYSHILLQKILKTLSTKALVV